MKVRLRKWFRNIGDGSIGDTVNATYRGVDSLGNSDGIGDGVVGKTYKVIILSKSIAILAPCPDFCGESETPKLGKKAQALVKKYKNKNSPEK